MFYLMAITNSMIHRFRYNSNSLNRFHPFRWDLYNISSYSLDELAQTLDHQSHNNLLLYSSQKKEDYYYEKLVELIRNNF